MSLKEEEEGEEEEKKGGMRRRGRGILVNHYHHRQKLFEVDVAVAVFVSLLNHVSEGRRGGREEGRDEEEG